jgi:crotonobetainyl-CoA:carnitine CoA-transferase CaiB-like acyl-CoA transferase
MGLLRAALRDFGELHTPDESNPVDVPLKAALPAGRLAEEAVRFADLAARRLGIPATPLDGDRIATAFTSERHFRINGETPDAWAPLSGFWRTADGWLRTHANYPHHERALLQALGIPEGGEERIEARKDLFGAALGSWSAVAAEEAVVAAGGVAAAVRSAAQWRAHPHGAGVATHPLLRIRDRSAASDTTASGRPRWTGSAGNRRRPLAGLRVLDLTRVLAGPICTRTLGLWGADVLRIDPPFLPEPEWIHFDTGPGKRSALFDLRSNRSAFAELLDRADVLVHGYRPGSLDGLGLDRLIEQRPHLVTASLSAWGPGLWADRRGFDSIVQAASGIAVAESTDGDRPGALPAQALDHSAGYLLAGSVALLLRRAAVGGGSWSVETSLARIAHELLILPPAGRPGRADFTPTVTTLDTPNGSITTAVPAIGREPYLFPARPFGADEPDWTPDTVTSPVDA